MKKQTLKSVMLALLTFLLCILCLCGCKEQQAPEPTVPDQKETFMQLLGFESYEEITGAKLAMGKMLGRMEINTDAQYLTQGSGSVKLTVQGNYNEPSAHPYIKLDFLNTSCTMKARQRMIYILARNIGHGFTQGSLRCFSRLCLRLAKHLMILTGISSRYPEAKTPLSERAHPC